MPKQGMAQKAAKKAGGNNLVLILMLAAGAILIYAAMKDKNPADVVRGALSGDE